MTKSLKIYWKLLRFIKNDGDLLSGFLIERNGEHCILWRDLLKYKNYVFIFVLYQYKEMDFCRMEWKSISTEGRSGKNGFFENKIDIE